jgi:hypothetical protein
MLSDRLKLFHEKMLQMLEPCYDKQTGFVHLNSDWTPSPNDRLIALAENSLYALALCQNKTAESIYKARIILQTLLFLQKPEGSFNRYLHEIAKPSCRLTTIKIEWVFKILIREHQLAVGNLLTSIEKALSHIKSFYKKENLELENSKNIKEIPPGIISDELIEQALAIHVQEGTYDQFLLSTIEASLTPNLSLNLLERGRRSSPVGIRESWLDLLIWFEGGAMPSSFHLGQLWNLLWHPSQDLGIKNLIENTTTSSFHVISRDFPQALQRRSLAQAVCWQLFFEDTFFTIMADKQTKVFENLQKILQLLVDSSQVCIRKVDSNLQSKSMRWIVQVNYEPLTTTSFDEDRPLLAFRTNQLQLWKLKNNTPTAISQEEMRQGLTLKSEKDQLHLTIIEAAGCCLQGFWHQHPIRSDQDNQDQPSHSQLYYQPLSPHLEGSMSLQLTLISS